MQEIKAGGGGEEIRQAPAWVTCATGYNREGEAGSAELLLAATE